MENLFKLNSNEKFTDNSKYAEILLEPWYHYIDENKGAAYRKIYIQAYNYWLKLTESEIELVKTFFQWVHTAYILMDDIVDFSELRRGNPAAYVLYGVGLTVTAIDFVTINYFISGEPTQSTEVLQDSHHTEILQNIEFNHCSQLLLQGQAMEIYWRDYSVCPTEEEYTQMIIRKTSQPLMLISNYMQCLTKTNINISQLTLLFGIYIQLTDDYSGLRSKLICDSKGFGDDIREGKFTLPFIHGINSRPKDKRLMGILKMRTTDIDLKMKCVQLLEEFGSMEYTRNKIIYFQTLVKKEIERMGLNDNKFKILFELVNFDQ